MDLFAILVEKYQITISSIILISSATNLAVVYLDAYTDTTVDTVKKIKTILGVTMEVFPIPQSCWGDVKAFHSPGQSSTCVHMWLTSMKSYSFSKFVNAVMVDIL